MRTISLPDLRRTVLPATCFASLLCILCTACGGKTPGGDDDIGADAPVDPPSGPTDPLDGLPTGVDQWTALCAKNYGDIISAKFCAGSSPPTVTSIKQLETLLGLDLLPIPPGGTNPNTTTAITMTGHSTGLGLRSVTPINPRAFVMTKPNQTAPNATYQVLAFSRGEPFVELVANDPAARTLRFFLLRFHPACEASAAGCTPADLLTPAIESNWTDYTLYDDDTIANTTVDCKQCHQPGGPSAPKLLRMQELRNPWRHWFYPEDAGNLATINDFMAAHGSEDYAGIPMANVMPSRPVSLERLVTNNGFATQPNEFDTNTIDGELAATGTSPTWNQLYARAVAGDAIAPPYFTVPQTDPTKLAQMSAAYRQTMAGTLPRDQMPDITDTLLDSALSAMSIRPQPGLDGRGIMNHMCRGCHNSRLDQSLSRANFNVDALATMSRGEKDKAIARLMLPESDARHMPPVRFHSLSDGERDLVINELSK